MSSLVFLFDLDSTITRKEMLPHIARECGMYEKMCSLDEMNTNGELPFKQSFISRVELLKDIPVSKVSDIVRDMELNEKLVDFIRENKERCFIVTGNLDVWIDKLMDRIGMKDHVFCSKAVISEDRIQSVFSVVDKNAVVSQMIMPFVAVGDGNNDAEMIEAAEVGIGYGGVHDVAPAVLDCATHVVYNEDKLVDFLEKLL